MSLPDLIRACREETDRFMARQPSCPWYGYELLRRAVCERDHVAWEAVVGHFHGLVLTWVRQHPLATRSQEDADYWVNRAFERFWLAVRPERFEQFPDLASLLKYLKACAHSLLADEARLRRVTAIGSLDEAAEGQLEAPDAAAQVAVLLAGQELWDIVLEEVVDRAERLVLYLSFVQDLKPRQVQERHPEAYPTVADVYRIKRNVLDRLRRNPRLRRLVAS
jgi:hypothetical protein